MAIKLVIRANPSDSVDPLGTILHNVALLPNVGDEIDYAADDGTQVHARVASRRYYFRGDDDPRVELIVDVLSPQYGVRSVGYTVPLD
jgi:hypothetical protein